MSRIEMDFLEEESLLALKLSPEAFAAEVRLAAAVKLDQETCDKLVEDFADRTGHEPPDLATTDEHRPRSMAFPTPAFPRIRLASRRKVPASCLSGF